MDSVIWTKSKTFFKWLDPMLEVFKCKRITNYNDYTQWFGQMPMHFNIQRQYPIVWTNAKDFQITKSSGSNKLLKIMRSNWMNKCKWIFKLQRLYPMVGINAKEWQTPNSLSM